MPPAGGIGVCGQRRIVDRVRTAIPDGSWRTRRAAILAAVECAVRSGLRSDAEHAASSDADHAGPGRWRRRSADARRTGPTVRPAATGRTAEARRTGTAARSAAGGRPAEARRAGTAVRSAAGGRPAEARRTGTAVRSAAGWRPTEARRTRTTVRSAAGGRPTEARRPRSAAGWRATRGLRPGRCGRMRAAFADAPRQSVAGLYAAARRRRCLPAIPAVRPASDRVAGVHELRRTKRLLHHRSVVPARPGQTVGQSARRSRPGGDFRPVPDRRTPLLGPDRASASTRTADQHDHRTMRPARGPAQHIGHKDRARNLGKGLAVDGASDRSRRQAQFQRPQRLSRAQADALGGGQCLELPLHPELRVP